MLKCQTNTFKMGNKIQNVARKYFGLPKKLIEPVFEHGQWYIQFYNSEDELKIYAVADAEGGCSIDGFDFEEIQ